MENDSVAFVVDYILYTCLHVRIHKFNGIENAVNLFINLNLLRFARTSFTE